MKEQKQYLEAGKIVNTHGVRGSVRIQPWTSSPEFFCSLKSIYIDGKRCELAGCSVQKSCVIASIVGIDDIDKAIAIKNKVVFIDRNDVSLPEGEHFIQDLIGLTAINADTGAEIGQIKDVLELPANNVYVIEGEREILVPAIPEFVAEKNISKGYISFRLIEGM